MDCSPPGASVPGTLHGVGSHSLLQKIVPTQGSNPDLLHCRHILCSLSHQGRLALVLAPTATSLQRGALVLGSGSS